LGKLLSNLRDHGWSRITREADSERIQKSGKLWEQIRWLDWSMRRTTTGEAVALFAAVVKDIFQRVLASIFPVWASTLKHRGETSWPRFPQTPRRNHSGNGYCTELQIAYSAV